VLNEGAAQKKLGKIKHTADAVPVMFFGTLEIAWIGQADIVCFKDGVMQGFLVKGKHKSFLRACGQVGSDPVPFPAFSVRLARCPACHDPQLLRMLAMKLLSRDGSCRCSALDWGVKNL